MDNKNWLIGIVCGGLLLASCVNAPDFGDVPEIAFVGWDKTQMKQGGLNNDSVFITLSYKDGDGDLSHPASDSTRDIFIYDTRTGQLQENLKLPEIPEDGTGNGINGEITMRIYTTCCYFPKSIPPCTHRPEYPNDTLQYEIYIRDRKGHQSNTIRTPNMVLQCYP